MKKVFFLSATAAILMVSTYAQSDESSAKNDIANLNKEEAVIKKEKKEDKKELKKLYGNKASYRAKEAFYRDFGTIPVSKWERTINFDEATFTKDGQQMKAFYDSDAQLVGTISPKTFADLPANAQKVINKRYKDYTIGDVRLFDDNEWNETDMVLYGQQFQDADNYFAELTKADKKIVVKVNMEGEVEYFKQMN